MFNRSLFTIATLTFASLAMSDLRAEEAQTIRFQRLFVFESAARPSIALLKGHFICRPLDAGRPALISSECQKQTGSAPALTRALTIDKAESVAFICPHCGRLIWQDTGRDVKLTEQNEKLSEKDLEAIVRITTELSKSN
jgi:hypothetical protein